MKSIITFALLLSTNSFASPLIKIIEVENSDAIAVIAAIDGMAPGRSEGKFLYKNSKNEIVCEASADCFYPAMGGRSNGQVPQCTIELTVQEGCEFSADNL